MGGEGGGGGAARGASMHAVVRACGLVWCERASARRHVWMQACVHFVHEYVNFSKVCVRQCMCTGVHARVQACIYVRA